MIDIDKLKAVPPRITMGAIMPNFNGANFISKAIQSLLDQTEAFDEIIIVDDGSTDNSRILIARFMQNNPRIRLVKHKEKLGVNEAIINALKHCSCDYILFCATDDWFGSTIVAQSKKIAMRYPGVGVICGDGIISRYDLKKPFYRLLPYPAHTLLSPEEFKTIACRSYVGFNSAGGMFMNRNAIIEAGLVYPEARWHADWLLYFVVALRYGIYYINEIFIHVDMRKMSYSEGKKHIKTQNKVMLDIVKIIATAYPALWDTFKVAALVPHHSIRYVLLFYLDPLGRKFITKRFIWKMLINNALIVRIGRLFSYATILKVRKWLRA